MAKKEKVVQTMVFLDNQGNSYQQKCVFELHDGVLSVYDCPILKEFNAKNNPYSVSYAPANVACIHTPAGEISDINKALWKKDFLENICKNCAMKCTHR